MDLTRKKLFAIFKHDVYHVASEFVNRTGEGVTNTVTMRFRQGEPIRFRGRDARRRYAN